MLQERRVAGTQVELRVQPVSCARSTAAWNSVMQALPASS